MLASAHLLTMIGTAWGDRRASPKALFFSIAVHVLLACGLMALVPEYRQRVVGRLVRLDDTPIRILTPRPPADVASAVSGTGNTPVWNQSPRAETPEWSRFKAPDLSASPDEALDQLIAPQDYSPKMADDLSPELPESRPVPQMVENTEVGPLEEASIAMNAETIDPEQRPEYEIPSAALDRAARQITGEESILATERPRSGRSRPDRSDAQPGSKSSGGLSARHSKCIGSACSGRRRWRASSFACPGLARCRNPRTRSPGSGRTAAQCRPG